MAKYGWLLDAKRCIECRACEVACKQWNGVETGINVRYRRVRLLESGSFPNVTTSALSLACNHCERPYCAMVCPVKAMAKRDSDGRVLVDQEKCVGCRTCEKFCPYQVPQFNAKTKKMEKCTLCGDRTEQGLQPACASLCPTGALTWGEWKDIADSGTAQIAGFTNPKYTQPNIRFVTEPWGKK